MLLWIKSKFLRSIAMLIVSPIILQGLSLFVSVCIFYVWVVRYQNIISEFKEYGIPEGLRDLVGILKLFFCACLLET